MAAKIDIMIQGVDKPTENNIRKRIDYLNQDNSKTPAYMRQAIPKQVKQAMQPYGYFHPSIKISSREYRGTTIMTIHVTPGPPLKLRRLQLEVHGSGQHEKEFEELIHKTQLRLHSPFRVPDYNRTKMGFFHIAEKLGYIKAKILDHGIKIDTEENTAEVKLVFDTGRRYYFGPVSFLQKPLAEELLRRYIRFQVGEPFSIKKLLELQDALRSSAYFSHVRVIWDENKSKNYRVPIQIELEPSKNKLYTFGMGYGTDTKIRGTFSYEKRRVNNQGHRFQSRLQASPVQSSLQARYIIPGRYPPTDEYQFFTTAVRYRLKQNDSLSTVIGASYLSHWREWTRTINLNYLIEWRRNRPGTPALVSRWLYPSVNFRRIHARNHINTDNGYRINIHLLGAHDGILAHDSFIKGLVEVKTIHSFNDFRFITRESFGMISINNINNLAAHFQFHAGGAQSIRGYQFQSIGPGKYLQIASVELQRKVYDKWRLAIFFDAGIASNKFKTPWKRGIGFGLVRETPIGSVEIGLARPLDSDKKGFNLVFSLGPDLA